MEVRKIKNNPLTEKRPQNVLKTYRIKLPNGKRRKATLRVCDIFLLDRDIFGKDLDFIYGEPKSLLTLTDKDWLNIARWDSWKKQTKLLKPNELTTIQAAFFMYARHPAIELHDRELKKVLEIHNRILNECLLKEDGTCVLTANQTRHQGRVVSRYAEPNDYVRSLLVEPLLAFDKNAYFKLDIDFGCDIQQMIFDKQVKDLYATTAEPSDFEFARKLIDPSEAKKQENKPQPSAQPMLDEDNFLFPDGDVTVKDLKRWLDRDDPSWLPRLKPYLKLAKELDSPMGLGDYLRKVKEYGSVIGNKLVLSGIIKKAELPNKVASDRDINALIKMLSRDPNADSGRRAKTKQPRK